MCKFFSCISDGENLVSFFRPENVAEVMAEGNKQEYDFNSHTSIAHYFKIDEDKWNKWEYNPETKELKLDCKNSADDKKNVLRVMGVFFTDKNVQYLRNLYGRNSGYRNSGYMNSGDMNSGDRNSGDRNSGDRNSGDRNSGDRNSGDMNSGYRNSGDMNSGDMNSGDRNSGDMNSGDRNSGYCNSSNVLNGFCSKDIYALFNKPCTEKDFKKAQEVFSSILNYFSLTEFVYESDMTENEKKEAPNYKINGGYLKIISYKKAWQNIPKEVIVKIKGLKNYSVGIFKDITGLNLLSGS